MRSIRLCRRRIYYYHALEHYKKISGDKLLELSEEVRDYVRRTDLAQNERFELVSQIAFSLFYSGNAARAYSLIREERTKYPDEFWKDDKNEANYWHVVALCAHDLDSNHDVVAAARRDVEASGKAKSYYDRNIARITLFDGYMALGELDQAEETARKVFDALEDRYYLHVDDILLLCYANLAIARFGDRSCIAALEKYRTMAKEAGYQNIVSLADCFLILAGYYMDHRRSSKISWKDLHTG